MESSINLFKKFLKESSKERINNSCGAEVFGTAKPGSQIDVTKARGLEMSSIDCFGDIGSVTLSIYFNIKSAKSLAAMRLGCGENEVSDTIARDFMKELSNVQGGSVRTFFESLLVGFRIGLPEHFFHIPEIVAPQEVKDSGEVYYWTLQSDSFEIVLSAEINLIDTKYLDENSDKIENELEKINLIKNDSSSLGAIEFFV